MMGVGTERAWPERRPAPSLRGEAVAELARVADAIAVLGGEKTREALLRRAADVLTELLDASACAVSRLEGDRVRDDAVVSHVPYASEPNGAYLLDDYPETRAVLELGQARAAALADEHVDPSEAFVLRRLGMSAVLMLPLRVDGEPWGLVEIYDIRRGRRFESLDTTVAGLVVAHVESLLAQLLHADALERVYRETLGSLSSALEAKDAYTSEHAQEVGDLAVAVGRRLRLDTAQLRTVELGALLHDIGKIRIPETILNKPGRLDEAEWEVMRSHPEAGERILAPIAKLAGILPIVRSSHERWDGCGYPDGLAAEAIPVGARIVAVCDAYRAMVEPRPYRSALARDVALSELRRGAGSQFDPACVGALLEALDEREREPVLHLHRPDHLRV
jgi:HD-GYP domain-containing protein (c-di-GMP phosphodiesterase class II)